MTNGMLFFLITKLINNHQHDVNVSKETGEERDENGLGTLDSNKRRE